MKTKANIYHRTGKYFSFTTAFENCCNTKVYDILTKFLNVTLVKYSNIYSG